jgi:23S rRNA (guanosine2251-2'-O)-methyltransferase
MDVRIRLAANFKRVMNNPHHLPAKDQLIMGVHAISELLQHAPEKIIKLYTSALKKSDLFDLCKKNNIPVLQVSVDKLTKMVGSDSHQSLVAHIRPRKYLEVEGFLKKDKEKNFVLMLDQIFDPQNFGALMRSAECFGVDAVVWSKNRGSDLTAVAAKTSCGASELLSLIRVSNLANAIEKFKQADYEVVATVLDEKAESAFDFVFAPKTVLIMGSEGEGIQPLLQKKSDRSIYLPMSGKIQSLNVAQAAAALLALKSSKNRIT